MSSRSVHCSHSFKNEQTCLYNFFPSIKAPSKLSISCASFSFLLQPGTLLDPYQALSPAQKDIQRQNTLQLLHRSLQIPESEAELQETLTLIQELNSLQIVLVQPQDQEREGGVETETLVESGWPQFYESAATHCGLCSYPLFKGGQR